MDARVVKTLIGCGAGIAIAIVVVRSKSTGVSEPARFSPRTEVTPRPEGERRKVESAAKPPPPSLDELPKAPPLKAAGWTQTDDVEFDPSLPKLIVGWATWCSACIGETAYLSALHDKYEGKVDVVAMSDESSVEILQRDVDLIKAGLLRTFPVATDIDRDKGTLKALAAAVGTETLILPSSWLVHHEHIIWHGSPGDAVAALDEVVTTGDAAKARELDGKLDGLREAYGTARKRGGGGADTPPAKNLLEALQGRPSTANSVAWDLLKQEDADVAFALQLASLAKQASLGKDPFVLDTYALALWKSGSKREALASQTESVRLCDALKERCSDERMRLAEYRAELKDDVP